MKLVPTINFGGNCREAIHTYEKAFGGRINCLITYGEADDPEYNPQLKEGQHTVQHLPMLGGDTAEGSHSLPPGQLLHQGSHLNGLRPGAKYRQNFNVLHDQYPLLGDIHDPSRYHG